jgi:HD-GYP domain-containing protein (c-di-GMP phosphodiesterase class II)
MRSLYIQSNDCGSYRDHLREKVLNNQDVPPARRYQVLREVARAVLSDALSKGDFAAAIEVTSDLGRDLVQTVCDSQVILTELLRVMSHDYSMFTHAMNVATYCLLIAQRLRIGDAHVLIEIGQGALLHDIGKLYIPKETLDKPGRLTEREQQIVKQHPTRGFIELCHREELKWGQLMMVYEHHERCDGRGYPAGLVRSEIHDYACLCAIADVCDALMRDRSYRPAVLRSDVVEYLDRQAGRGFDEEMARCWIATITSET